MSVHEQELEDLTERDDRKADVEQQVNRIFERGSEIEEKLREDSETSNKQDEKVGSRNAARVEDYIPNQETGSADKLEADKSIYDQVKSEIESWKNVSEIPGSVVDSEEELEGQFTVEEGFLNTDTFEVSYSLKRDAWDEIKELNDYEHPTEYIKDVLSEDLGVFMMNEVWEKEDEMLAVLGYRSDSSPLRSVEDTYRLLQELDPELDYSPAV